MDSLARTLETDVLMAITAPDVLELLCSAPRQDPGGHRRWFAMRRQFTFEYSYLSAERAWRLWLVIISLLETHNRRS
jgi:hypothetical protein